MALSRSAKTVFGSAEGNPPTCWQSYKKDFSAQPSLAVSATNVAAHSKKSGSVIAFSEKKEFTHPPLVEKMSSLPVMVDPSLLPTSPSSSPFYRRSPAAAFIHKVSPSEAEDQTVKTETEAPSLALGNSQHRGIMSNASNRVGFVLPSTDESPITKRRGQQTISIVSPVTSPTTSPCVSPTTSPPVLRKTRSRPSILSPIASPVNSPRSSPPSTSGIISTIRVLSSAAVAAITPSRNIPKSPTTTLSPITSPHLSPVILSPASSPPPSDTTKLSSSSPEIRQLHRPVKPLPQLPSQAKTNNNNNNTKSRDSLETTQPENQRTELAKVGRARLLSAGQSDFQVYENRGPNEENFNETNVIGPVPIRPKSPNFSGFKKGVVNFNASQNVSVAETESLGSPKTPTSTTSSITVTNTTPRTATTTTISTTTTYTTKDPLNDSNKKLDKPRISNRVPPLVLGKIKRDKERLTIQPNTEGLKMYFLEEMPRRRSYSEPFLHSWDYHPEVPIRQERSTPNLLVPKQNLLISEDLFSKQLTRKSSEYITLHDLEKPIVPTKQQIEFEEKNGKRVIVAGTVAQLIDLLVKPSASQDQEFIDVFLLTHSYFISPEELLNKLMDIFYSLPTEELQEILQLRVMNILRKWVKMTRVVEDEAFSNLLMKNITNMLAKGGKIRKWALNLQQTISSSPTLTRTMSIQKELVFPIPDSNSSTSLYMKYTMCDLDPLEVAQELTLIDSEMLHNIRISDFLHKRFEKPEKGPTIHALIQRFNQVGAWIKTEIVSTPNIKQRVVVVHRFIEIAQHLRDLNNFSGFMQVITALQHSSIARLTQTWKLVSNKYMYVFKQLSDIASPQGNYATYRSLLDTSSLPLVPFTAVILKDLTFIEEMSNTVKPKGSHGSQPGPATNIINFNKMRLLGRILRSIQLTQQTNYGFQSKPNLRAFLSSDNMFVLPEDAIFKIAKATNNEESNPFKVSSLGLSSTTGLDSFFNFRLAKRNIAFPQKLLEHKEKLEISSPSTLYNRPALSPPNEEFSPLNSPLQSPSSTNPSATQPVQIPNQSTHSTFSSTASTLHYPSIAPKRQAKVRITPPIRTPAVPGSVSSSSDTSSYQCIQQLETNLQLLKSQLTYLLPAGFDDEQNPFNDNYTANSGLVNMNLHSQKIEVPLYKLLELNHQLGFIQHICQQLKQHHP